MHKRWLTCAVLLLVVAISRAGVALAHGEAADQPFLKDLTTAFYDVHISPTMVEVGQPVTVTGTVQVLDTWPYTLAPPQTAYITPVVPGPVFALTERHVNGEPAPGSIFVERGQTYQFKMVMLGRIPGRYHVHPGFAVQGTGTLIGPGEWITVEPSAVKFEYPVKLIDGTTINLETYGGSFVWWWSFAGFVLGVIWMVYWTVPKRTVTRLAVTSQLPVNDSAPDIGLITRTDHFWMSVLAALTIALLVGGWIYMAAEYPVRLPQQTVRTSPEFINTGVRLAEIRSAGTATYDPTSRTLVMKMSVKNVSANSISIKQYIMAMATFVSGGPEAQKDAGPPHYVGQVEVEPDIPIAPGVTQTVTLTIASELFAEERLIPEHDPQQVIAGLVRVATDHGQQELVTVKSTVMPTEYRAKYLP
ncbi:MAG: methane monooxygenase/ammonia monooxygenase subunit B [Candidatus Binataceae bacterium]